jgi:glycerophosphoryl diester phosphodiesterase
VAAHRGAHRAASENSVAAVERAIELGADMVEFDVRRSRDGILIARHDAEVDGTPVHSLAFDDLSGLLGTAPARVEDILSAGSGRVWFDIELKEAGYEDEVLDLAQATLLQGTFFLTSFLPEALLTLQGSDAVTGLLHEGACPAQTVASKVRACGADIFLPRVEDTNGDVIEAAAKEAIPVILWTVNDPAEMQHSLFDGRIAGIITDDPSTALAIRRGASVVTASET